MSSTDALPTIYSRDFIMAYGHHSKLYIQPEKQSPVCSCQCWSQYSLFVLNVLIWASGGALIGFGAWAQVNIAELELFKALLTVPSWLLIATGIVMVVPGVFGCAGSARLNIHCLRTFMLLLVTVFVMQVVMGAVLFFRMDELEDRMLAIMKSAIVNYHTDVDFERDKALDYMQRQFACCGGSSFSDWESNKHYNCSNTASLSSCAVPASCCRGTKDEQCGYGVRAGTKDYSDMFAYTEGCVVALTSIFKENVVVITALAFCVCFLEICCLVLSSIISKHIVRKTNSLTSDNYTNTRILNSKFTPSSTNRYYR
ncbi:hypothetical protein BsWGS_12780 [Bradybaena similaris]